MSSLRPPCDLPAISLLATCELPGLHGASWCFLVLPAASWRFLALPAASWRFLGRPGTGRDAETRRASTVQLSTIATFSGPPLLGQHRAASAGLQCAKDCPFQIQAPKCCGSPWFARSRYASLRLAMARYGSIRVSMRVSMRVSIRVSIRLESSLYALRAIGRRIEAARIETRIEPRISSRVASHSEP